MEADNMPMTARQMVRLLKKNGFSAVRQKGSHLRMYNSSTNVAVTIPMHPGELNKWIEEGILRDAGIERQV